MVTRINQINGSFIIGGKCIHEVKTMVIDNDGSITINGKPIGDITDFEQQGVVKIEITGNVGELSSSAADVTIHGDATSIHTQSGDVRCKEVHGSVSTMSGDVHCGNVQGGVSTMSGDIFRG